MANLPDTLEAMQRDILHYDLSLNPYLQKSSVPAKDKELKTNAKRIIPAINELLRLLNTFSSGIQNFMEDTQKTINDMLDQIEQMSNEIEDLKKSNVDKDSIIEDLSKKYDECLNKIQELEFDINTIRQYCNNNDLEDIEMKFDSKVKLTKGESVVTKLKASDICDPEKQIKIYAYDEESGKYKYINPEFKMSTSSVTIYKFTTSPVEIVPDIDTDVITLKNTTNWPLIIYLFKIS